MATLIDLNPNVDILDFKFEGYKISLDPIPVLKRPIIGGIESFELSGDQYGYLQIRMSALLNHLFQDPWFPECVFFINEKQHIYWSCLTQDSRLAEPRIVWQLPVDTDHITANSTIGFPGSEWAIVSNGIGGIYLLNTSSRTAGEPWQICHSYFLEKCHSPCYLLHSIHRSLPSGQQIDCLLTHVCQPKDVQENQKSFNPTASFVCVLEWLSFSCGQSIQAWSMKRWRRFVGNSSPEYAAIEPAGAAICVASETDFIVSFDSDKPAEQYEVEEKENKEKGASLYTYIQTADDITAIFRLHDKIIASDVQVMFHPSRLEVLVKGKTVLKGQLWNFIDTTASTWTIDGQKLEIILFKQEVGLMWQEFVKGDRRGEEIMDPALVEEIHSRLAHLTSDTEATPTDKMPFNLQQLEECDSCTDVFTFLRIDGDSHKETHKILMGGHQWLFSKQICPESLPIICLRHDVDGIIWQPKNVSSEGELEHFKMEHIATFSALGYVQASKQDKKFTLCSPNFQYSVITDCVRHIYIYRQPENLHSALELRNRKTGEAVSHIAKQHVVNLEECDKILGLQVSNECIFVLSKQMLYAIKMAVN